MKNNKILILTISVVLLTAVFFNFKSVSGKGSQDSHESIEETDDNHEKESGHKKDGENFVRFSDAELKEFGIEIGTAGPGDIDQYIELPGEIVLNSDRVTHVVPRVSGIVRDVRIKIGDRVKKGELLSVLESRELADAKAVYLAAVGREKLARTNYQREERLWEKKVTSEKEYLDAKQLFDEAGIVRNSAEQQLHAMGVSDEILANLAEQHDTSYTRFEIRAPQNGTVIEKHMTLGENIGADTDVLTIADLSSVWVNLNVYQKDLVSIHKGQQVKIEIGHGIPSASGTIAWVSPEVDEATRTATARIELSNPDGNLRPGLFITASTAVSSAPAQITIPVEALQNYEGNRVVFVDKKNGFEPVPVQTGRENGILVEVLSGLGKGSRYVTKGAFTLKAQLGKDAFGDGHNH